MALSVKDGMSKQRTITYIEHDSDELLDSEITSDPVPRQGQPIMFLGQEGHYRVRDVRDDGEQIEVRVGRVDMS